VTAAAQDGQLVTLHYTMTFEDGTTGDDTRERGTPATVTLVGPDGCCSPCHSTHFVSETDGTRCLSMTWRAISARLSHPTRFEPSSLETTGAM